MAMEHTARRPPKYNPPTRLLQMNIKLNIITVVICLVVAASAINRDDCASTIRNEIRNQSLTADNSTFFYKRPVAAKPEIPLSLRLQSCLNKCGRGFSWYSGDEISNRIVGWLIPVLVLIGNMHMPPLSGSYKAFSILHFIGDPIDSMLSLQHTLGVRHAAHVWAGKAVTEGGLVGRVQPRDLAAVFWVLDTFSAGSSKTPIHILEPLLHLPEFPSAISEAAADIRHTTVQESARTYLAILTYLSTITTAFVRASSSRAQCQTRPGNRVALAILYCWLLPAILLSTFAGRFTTSEASVRAIKRFTRHLRHSELTETSLLPTTSYSRFIMFSVEDRVQDALSYSGAIYIYRPCKPLFTRPFPFYPSPVRMLILSIIPILIAMCVAIAISYNTPTVGFGCRSIAEVSIGCMWLLSFVATLLLQNHRIATGKFQVLLVGAKDFLLGGGALLAVAIIYAGAFNSCWCWSNGVNGVLRHSLHVLLGVDGYLQANSERIYPGLVGGGLGAQVAGFLLMWREVWGEKRKSWWTRALWSARGSDRPGHTAVRSDSEIPLVERNLVPRKDHR